MSRNEILIRLEEILSVLLEGKGVRLDQVDTSKPLYEEGYGLTSMDTATFAALLSEEFGDDPYMAGEVPQSLQEIADYYARIRA